MDISKIRITIGNNLLKARRELGITQTEVADQYEKLFRKSIDERTIRRYEDGDITLEGLLYMAEFYNKTIDYFLYGHETMRDDSLKWEDQLKRLNRLVYSAVLVPQKCNEMMSPYYGKYIYVSPDEETNLHMERVEVMCKTKNYLNRKGKPDFDHMLKDFDSEVSRIVDKEDEILLDINRIVHHFRTNNEDPLPFIKKALDIALKNKETQDEKKRGS